MAEEAPEVVVVEQRIDAAVLARLVELFFGDMVKYGRGEPLP